MSAPPLPKSGQNLVAVLNEHGWTVHTSAGRQSLGGTWWHTVFAYQPQTPTRKLQVTWLGGRLQSALCFQAGRGWGGWVRRSLRETAAYIRSFGKAEATR